MIMGEKEEIRSEEPIDRLVKMMKEDLAKECNKDIVLSVAGVKFSKENLLFNDEEEKELLRDIYFKLIEIFEYYMDDTPENIMLYSLWIIGTYFHDKFNSYPYLFINAMRGSGKSRLLKLLACLGNGKYTCSVTEAIIFRTSGLICIDEMESIGNREKGALRELLNASYKKGMTIMRTIKKKDITGDTQKIEEFEPYRPIAMANIWGMDEILGDRCITRILEKSDNPIKTRVVENYDTDLKIQELKIKLKRVSLCRLCTQKTYNKWNDFVHWYYNNTNYTNYTKYTNDTEETILFRKIIETGIFGRNLELFMPIFIISSKTGDDVLDIVLKICKKLNEEKKDTEAYESIDVMVYEFISKQNENLTNYIKIRELFDEFKNYYEFNEEWMNLKWFGKALKRLNLLIDKKRKAHGKEVLLNVLKAKEKLKIFRKEEAKE